MKSISFIHPDLEKVRQWLREQGFADVGQPYEPAGKYWSKQGWKAISVNTEDGWLVVAWQSKPILELVAKEVA